MIHSQVFGSESDLYNFFWLDPDKKVFVLQNKYFKNTNKTFISAGYLIDTSSNFQDVKGFGLTVSHFISETVGIELESEFYSHKDNDTLNLLLKIVGKATPFIRRPKSYVGINYLWVPFYGKINTFNKIIYLDWGFGAGLGSYKTESNAKTVAFTNNRDNFDKESYISAKFKTFFKINVNQKYQIKLSYDKKVFSAPGPKSTDGTQNSSIRNNDSFTISFGFGF